MLQLKRDHSCLTYRLVRQLQKHICNYSALLISFCHKMFIDLLHVFNRNNSFQILHSSKCLALTASTQGEMRISHAQIRGHRYVMLSQAMQTAKLEGTKLACHTWKDNQIKTKANNTTKMCAKHCRKADLCTFAWNLPTEVLNVLFLLIELV